MDKRSRNMNLPIALKESRNYIKDNHSEILRRARKINKFLPVIQAIDVWVCILCCVLVTQAWIWFAPLSIVIIGFKQRLLNNVVHGASHLHHIRHRWINDWFAQLFGAFALFDNVVLYRKQHLAHHAQLGEMNDPDHIICEHGDEEVRFSHAYWALVLDGRRWTANFFGRLLDGPPAAKAFILLWWLLAVILVGLLGGWGFLVYFLTLWFVSKATVYHLVCSFTELADHGGLDPANPYSYSRTMPDNLLSCFMHPYGDSYHLAHHLFPEIHSSRLKMLHEKLMKFKKYRDSPHFNAYFFGRKSLINSRILKPRPKTTNAL
jgi:fatty acid desaturase